MSRRFVVPRPATVLSVVAIVLALSGTAIAAKHYLITSTKQISPTVLKSLRGAKGATGARGATGATGPAGANGTNGANGTAGTNGHDGNTGPIGPSNVYQSFVNGPTGFAPDMNSQQAIFLDLARNHAAKAKYNAMAKLVAQESGGPGTITCTLYPFGAGSSGGSDTSALSTSGPSQVLVMDTPADFTDVTATDWGFVVYCDTPVATTMNVTNAKITAFQTGNIVVDTG